MTRYDRHSGSAAVALRRYWARGEKGGSGCFVIDAALLVQNLVMCSIDFVATVREMGSKILLVYASSSS